MINAVMQPCLCRAAIKFHLVDLIPQVCALGVMMVAGGSLYGAIYQHDPTINLHYGIVLDTQ